VSLRALILVGALAALPSLAAADGGTPPPKLGKRGGNLERACGAGDAKACVELGLHHVDVYYAWNGGNRKDVDAAMALFQKACGLGNVAGCRQVGWMYLEGAVAKDDERARQMFRQACDAGDGGGCTLLAGMIEKGGDLRKVSREALALYEKACAGPLEGLGCISGCDDLGFIYYYGRDIVPEDRVKAAGMYEKACNAGCGSSCDKAGDMLRDGDGPKQDLAHAAHLYDEACKKRFAPSCASLSELYRDGRGVARDPAKAKSSLERACTLSRNQVEQCIKR
jgi:TPR repeat protein